MLSRLLLTYLLLYPFTVVSEDFTVMTLLYESKFYLETLLIFLVF